MNKNIKYILGLITLGLIATFVYAATTPQLLSLQNIAVLATTFNHNGGTTTLNGSLGYTGEAGTGVLVVTGTTNANYSQNGTDQAVLLSTGLDVQTCDFTFGSDTDLSLLSQPLSSGVYCVTGDMSIGTGGITLTGAGTYIFRSTGALNTVANSIVTLSGASACDVFWTPGAATTLGANSTFVGTNIDDAGITIGSTVNWIGRALSFASTVTADTDTITAPSCTLAVPTLHRRRRIVPPVATTTVEATTTNDISTPLTIVATTSVEVIATTTFPTSVMLSDIPYTGYTGE